MPYCTVAAVRLRSPLLTEAAASDPMVESAIADADAEIDAALAHRYTVPFAAPVPAIIQTISRGLAIGSLILELNSRDPEKTPKIADTFTARARKQLEDIAAGTYRGMDFLVSRANLPGQTERATAISSTFGKTPKLRDFDLYTEPS